MSRNFTLVCVCLFLHVATVFCQFGFFPQREERRQPFGFAQNFFPNPRRITETLSGILHFQPGNQDRNQQNNPFNVGISNNNRPNYDQYRPNRPNQLQNPQNVRFPNTDVPYDNVNYEQPYGRPNENPGFNSNPEFNNVNPGNNFNGGFVPGNGENGQLVSGSDNNGPVFGGNVNGGVVSGDVNPPAFNNDNGGFISGNVNNPPVFNNDNGGLVSGNVNNPPPFNNDNGGLVSGNVNNPPAFNNDNGGLISGNVNNPPFSNDNGGLISGTINEGLVSGDTYDERPVFPSKDSLGTPSPVSVVEEADNVPVFGDRNAETDDVTSSPALTEGKTNMVFDNGPIFKDTCQTVDGGIGTCVSIKGCKQYIKLVQESRTNPEAVRVLRGSLCGFEGDNPKVPMGGSDQVVTAAHASSKRACSPPDGVHLMVCCPAASIPDAPPPSPRPPQPTPTAAPKTALGDFVGAFPEPPECGVSNASFSRVVGGVKAKLGDFPWMTLLGYKSQRDGSTRWLCGGSLVTSRHVMTAAHCIHNHETDLYVVRLGELDLAREDEGATPVDVIIKRKLKHENYDPKGFTNDIGILFLERDVQFTDLIRPICIPKDAELRARSFENYNPIIAGWGDTEFRGPSATHLQVLQLPVVSNDQCAQVYSAYKAQVIDKRVLCAGYKSGGKDACQGDSGGPLMQPIWNSETYTTFFYQIGVVSFGKQCALAGFPGVYTRVTEFVPWIQKNMLGSA